MQSPAVQENILQPANPRMTRSRPFLLGGRRESTEDYRAFN
jgi:hypothetical protein